MGNKIEEKELGLSLFGIIILVCAVGLLLCFLLFMFLSQNDVYKMGITFFSGLLGTIVGSYYAITGSNNIQKNIRNKEKIKSEKENARIVYYDLLLGLNDLKKLYLGCHKPRKMYFSNDWIKNVSIIGDQIEGQLEKVYTLYGDLLTIADYLEGNKKEDELNKLVNTLSEKVFSRDFKLEKRNNDNQVDSIRDTFRNEKVKGIIKLDEIDEEVYRPIIKKLSELCKLN